MMTQVIVHLVREAQGAAGLPLTGTYILRHTFCSRLAARGATPRASRSSRAPIGCDMTTDAAVHHTYHDTIPVPPGFGELYLHDYIAKANGSNASNTSDIYPGNFVQSLRSLANKPSTGDISFGSADEDGPTTSFAAEMVGNFDCWNCELEWPAWATIYSVQADSKALRIGWGERGGQHEGWFPWWSGTIRIR